jgi:hypothetical protein
MMVLLAGQPAPLIDVCSISAFGGQLGSKVVVRKVCLERCEGGGQRLEREDASKDGEEQPLDARPSPRGR